MARLALPSSCGLASSVSTLLVSPSVIRMPIAKIHFSYFSLDILLNCAIADSCRLFPWFKQSKLIATFGSETTTILQLAIDKKVGDLRMKCYLALQI